MSDTAGRGSTAVEDRSIAQLIQDLSEQMRRLVRDELRLATEELKQKGRHAGLGAGLAGFAGITAFFGAAVLIAAAVLGLALVLPGWAAAVIIGGALLVVAGIAGLVGTRQLKAAVPPIPEEAAAGVQKDVEIVKQRGHGNARA
ncbi:phage holin family protein [Amycolatopsis dongchuanensis]|uniref:Phage holin family protein n=1 Tax=Amycolatopsis dongchuanensis TaxID=1070866 RepID=A0ABP8VEZ3_9PSEU